MTMTTHRKDGRTRFMTEAEFAELTGLSRNTLRTWRCRRVGPPTHKLLGAVRYGADALEWLDNQSRKTAAA